MSIYPVLSDYYDDLFPAKEAALSFLAERSTPGGSLLDIGCGTGNHCCGLAERGFQMVGIDPDSLMIEKARLKVAGDNPLFQTAGIESVSSMERRFDTVYCIGNTLPHLSDMEAVRASFAAVYAILVSGGMYIVQTVNYDRVLKDTVTSLPPLTAGNVTLKRLYSHTEGGKAIQFEIQLSVKEEGGVRVLKDQVRLLPLKKQHMVELAEQAGFTGIAAYGGFQGEGYSVESGGTILSMQKP